MATVCSAENVSTENYRYLQQLRLQRYTPRLHRLLGLPTELRLQTEDNPNGKWLWFKSQYAAAKWLFGDAFEGERSTAKVRTVRRARTKPATLQYRSEPFGAFHA